MKKKILIIIFSILVILLIVVSTFKLNKNAENKNETSRNFILSSNSNSKVNTKGENAGIYVGINGKEGENFHFVSIKINKNTSKEEQVKSLISSISNSIGYKIDVNSVKIDGNNIKIDFAKTAAPFELEESYDEASVKAYNILNQKFVAKTIFDSVNKTLKSYFGIETNSYFSADGENIHIEIENNVVDINKDELYK